MKVKLLRYSDNGNSTLGIVFIDNVFTAYSLEDEYRDIKVSGETRVPHGIYELVKYKTNSPMTRKYRDKYSWFEWHIMLKDVPNFKNVYIHIGNKEKNTDGCILLGSTANNNKLGEGFIGSSTNAFKRFYTLIYEYLDDGQTEIEIIDYDRSISDGSS